MAGAGTHFMFLAQLNAANAPAEQSLVPLQELSREEVGELFAQPLTPLADLLAALPPDPWQHLPDRFDALIRQLQQLQGLPESPEHGMDCSSPLPGRVWQRHASLTGSKLLESLLASDSSSGLLSAGPLQQLLE